MNHFLARAGFENRSRRGQEAGNQELSRNSASSRRRLLLFSGILVCLGCQTPFERPQDITPALEVGQWGVIESGGRIADWAAQLPVGEAKREGIIGVAIV
jgi:hypothetical protein